MALIIDFKGDCWKRDFVGIGNWDSFGWLGNGVLKDWDMDLLDWYDDNLGSYVVFLNLVG